MAEPRGWGLVALLLLTLAPAVAAAAPAEWPTPAERSGFEATPDYRETIDFLRRLEARLPAMQLGFYGVSAQGRPLPVVVVSKTRAFTPAAARAAGLPIVLIQNGIHSGEIDGKDACLMILRDLALGRHPEILDAATLVIVPIYNVDGHERISPYNRAHQNGPRAGMGFRTTASGLDLNRDHLKLVSPEARAMIALFNDWRPDLHVDDHVTNGSDHDWVLTYSWAEAPQIDPALDAWLSEHMPRVVRATEAAGHRVGPYVGLLDGRDPAKGFDTNVPEPRYATGYYPLRHRVSVLVENHAYKPYRDRVLANRDFLLALIREVGRGGAGLRAAVAAAERRTVARGGAEAEPSDVVVRWEPADPDRVRWPAYEWYLETSIVTAAPLLRFRRGVLHEVEVPWIHRMRPALSLPRPRGYLVEPGWPVIEQRLRGHGLRVERLTRPAELEVETIRVADPTFARAPYQGLTRVTDVEVSRPTETRSLPAGTLWVPADQPDFEVAVQLLEPEAPDSLLAWGLLSSVFERKEWIGAARLEDLALELLRDPAVKAEWEQALTNETFAADARARWEWWYRRTPFWDDEIGRLPVTRLMRPAALTTARWGAGEAGEPAVGRWRAWLDSPGGELPFGLELSRDADGWRAFLLNGPERIPVPRTVVEPGALTLSIPHYDSRVRARLGPGGRRLDGEWTKTGGGGKPTRLAFHAVHGDAPRFAPLAVAAAGAAPRGIDGRWRVRFESEELPAVGMFERVSESAVVGTFLTATGDYRYLAGSFEHGRLRLSCFDGAHAFLFDARLGEDGTLAGDFWSRDTWHETWTAVRDPEASLVDPFELTRWTGAAELRDLRFPDLDGNPRSLDDPAFAGKARIIEVFGSWCPNCNDAAAYLGELDRRYRDRGLRILGLAFELTGDFERDAAQVRRYMQHHGLEFPVLVAGTSDKGAASEAFPAIDRVRSYPTTIFVDARGRVRAIHTGYSGPATGAAYAELRARFEALIERMLAEAD